jgi:acyl-coenzyme A thioesterase 13
MTAATPFVSYVRTSRYLELIGPLYQYGADASIVGLRTDDRHTNSRGAVHGGVLVAIADTIMGHSAERASATGGRVVTVSLSIGVTQVGRGPSDRLPHDVGAGVGQVAGDALGQAP